MIFIFNFSASFNREQIFLDGAHCPGQLLLDNVPQMNIDYYAANLHKCKLISIVLISISSLGLGIKLFAICDICFPLQQ